MPVAGTVPTPAPASPRLTSAASCISLIVGRVYHECNRWARGPLPTSVTSHGSCAYNVNGVRLAWEDCHTLQVVSPSARVSACPTTLLLVSQFSRLLYPAVPSTGREVPVRRYLSTHTRPSHASVAPRVTTPRHGCIAATSGSSTISRSLTAPSACYCGCAVSSVTRRLAPSAPLLNGCPP